ncbi:class I SAM-dependent DNA methyltransferase [Corynebacterium falsenii]
MPKRPTAQRVNQARLFASKWKGRGYEKGDTSSFWLELLRDVVGMEDVTTNVLFEQATSKRGYIDVSIPDAKTFIEQKSLGVDLDKPELRQGVLVTPFQQARNYADSRPNNQRPDFIVVCDFNEFRLHDLNKQDAENDYVTFTLDELPDQLHLLDFLIDPQLARQRRETAVSINAGDLIGRLYDKLRGQFLDPDSAESQHALNVLCVRLVFCLFAEDAGLFPKDAFYRYLAGTPAHMVRDRLKQLFVILDTPVDQRDPYLDDEAKAFPYVNGGLFAQPEEIPPFTQDIVDTLLEEVSRDTNWAKISPTIFGGVFESTLNPETRAQGGMHYTSPENIHKVIDPLFMNDLREELDSILSSHVKEATKRRKLLAFHEKIAGLSFFDPACGSGNFLTETYLTLRRMENKILSELMNEQIAIGFDDIGATELKVSLAQFHGLEINDFAVSVASTALWIAQLQANLEAETIVQRVIEDLPLHDAATIRQGNALTTDWSEVIAPEECDFIMGNPPFLGARNQSKEQKQELKDVFPAGTRNVGNIDYVAGWYIKAADFIGDHPIRCAYVSTNSICQGEQVANIWSPILDLGFKIDFAHDTFRWANESKDSAHVYCVIVGFSKLESTKVLYHYDHPDSPGERIDVTRLNPYLVDAPDVLVWNRSKPLSPVPKIGIGSQPIDDGNYLFSDEEKESFVQKEPASEAYFHRWLGSQEFIKGKSRWVLWLGNVSPQDLKKMPLSRERIEKVREFRSRSKRAQTVKAASTPHHFGTELIPSETSILVPKVSSERRNYIPLGFVEPEIFCSDLVFLIPDATLYHFGVLHSQFHNAWMRSVAGRLESRYRYSGGVVYNNFVWPEATDEHRDAVAACAQQVLDARNLYPDSTIADMYDPDNDFLFPELVTAHRKLDRAVEAAYGVDFQGDELAIVTHLFGLYADTTHTSFVS